VVEKLGFTEPAVAGDDLTLQRGDVDGGPAEGRRTQLQEERAMSYNLVDWSGIERALYAYC
jgi:hypothetical protein